MEPMDGAPFFSGSLTLGRSSADKLARCCAAGNGRQGNQVLGRSRNGFSCEIHSVRDFDGLPIAFHLTGGETSDTTQLEISLDIGPDITPRVAITRLSGQPRGLPQTRALSRPYRRAKVEQTIGKPIRFKRIAMHCDKTTDSYGAFVALACSPILIKSVHWPESANRISPSANSILIKGTKFRSRILCDAQRCRGPRPALSVGPAASSLSIFSRTSAREVYLSRREPVRYRETSCLPASPNPPS